MFWDSSALVPLVLPELRRPEMAALLRTDREVVIWWASSVECQSAICRRHHESTITVTFRDEALQKIQALIENAAIIPPTDVVRQRTGQLLIQHPLRAADALQLAAAVVWSEGQPSGESFVCLDKRLREAALREGFRVLPGK